MWWGERGGKAVHGEPWAEADVNLDSDPLYARFVTATLTAFRAGQSPPVSMDVMVPIMEVVDAAYASARTGQPIPSQAAEAAAPTVITGKRIELSRTEKGRDSRPSPMTIFLKVPKSR